MNKKLVTLLGTVLVWTYAYAFESGDTTQNVADFTLEEQEITLKMGESRQLHVNPDGTTVRWMESWNLADNPYAIVDEKGLVTALRKTNAAYYVQAESLDGSISKQCKVTVLDEGGLRKDIKAFEPADESEWTDVSFSLSNDGVFTAEGTFYGSGAKTNYLNYIATDQCVFLWFDINYEDSTKSFYPQPFSIEIGDCNAQEYTIYLNNKSKVVGTQQAFAQYTILRGTSGGGTTKADRIAIKKDDDLFFNLKGQTLNSEPEKGFYIKDGKLYHVK